MLPAAANRRCSSPLSACAGLPTALQKKGYEEIAKGPTAQEWMDFMTKLQANVQAELAKPEVAAAWEAATGGTPQQCPPIFSFDNPNIHTASIANLKELGLAAPESRKTAVATESWLVLPPYSGDLHRTIERVHARVCGQFQRWVDDDRAVYTMKAYCQCLKGFFELTQTPEVISKCMKTLPKLYQHVLEVQGAKARRPFK